MNVFTFAYDTCCGDSLVSVFDSIDAVITRLELMKLHDNFDECESVTIRCEEIVDNDEMTRRLNNVKEYYAKRDAK